MEERKKNLLKLLEEFFQGDEDAEEVSLFEASELGAPMDVLRVLITQYGAGLRTVLAEFSFLPLEGGDDIWVMTAVITLKTDISSAGAAVLSSVMSRLNFYLPYGGFALSSNGRMLVFKSTTALRSDWEDERIYQQMEISADMALTAAEPHVESLISVASGDMTVEQFMSMLPA